MFTDLNDILEKDVESKYYMASGYLDTFVKHRKRQESKGYGFGYRVVNEPGIQSPVANTYSFIDENGVDKFSFPMGIPNLQK